VPGPGVVVERSYIPSQPYEIAKNGEKTVGFAHVFAYKSPKTPFFAIKYFTRNTHETFFEEYINFKIFRNLSHFGVITVRSFGSHIRPQPHGLGLRYIYVLQVTWKIRINISNGHFNHGEDFSYFNLNKHWLSANLATVQSGAMDDLLWACHHRCFLGAMSGKISAI
jgi:hypothetical protein